MLKKLIAILFFVPLLGSTCQSGSAHFESELKNLPFNPNGTVFAYVESEKDAATEKEMPKYLHVMMTWISIDPARDLNQFSNAQREDIKNAFMAHDALSFTVDINTSKITTSWIQLDKRTEASKNATSKAELLQAMKLQLEQNINYYTPPLFIQGAIQFKYAASLISGTFTAPILQGNAAQIAQKNWEELKN